MNNDSWKNEFLKCLELGTTNTSLTGSFDQIIEWVNSADDEIYKSFIQKYTKEWFDLRYEEFLDRLFVAETAVAKIFPSSMRSEDAKKRYRQLMRVFHPDRGSHEEVWLNYRAERINHAYKAYENNTSEAIINDVTKPGPVTVDDALKKPLRPKNKTFRAGSKIKYKPNLLRQKLGSARQVQRKIILSLIVCALVLILLVYASTKDINNHQSISDNSSNYVNNSSDEQSYTSINKNNENNLDDIIADRPELQAMLDEAEWLNDSSQYIDTTEDVSDSFDEEFNVNEPVNFSNFDTQTARLELSDSIEISRKQNGSSPKDSLKAFIDRESKTREQKRTEEKNTLSTSKETRLIKKKSTTEKLLPQTINNTKSAKQNINKDFSEKSPSSNKPKLKTNPSENFRRCEDQVDNYSTVVLSKERTYEVKVNLNVRSRPSEYCALLDSVARDSIVRVQRKIKSQSAEWALVEWVDPDGRKKAGWVMSQYLRPQAIKSEWQTPNVPPGKNVPAQETKTEDAFSVQKVNKPDTINKQDHTLRIREQALAVLAKLKNAYEIGNAEVLASLYTSSGRENRVKGVTSIAKIYAKLFKQTEARFVKYKIKSYTVSSDKSVVLNGTMASTAIVSSNGRTHRTNATVEFTMIPVGNDYKIQSFMWKPVK